MKISHRSFAVASLLVSLISLPCSAANFTLEQVMSSPFPSNLIAAKRSGRIAWVFNAKGVRNLWIADAPNFAARQVTHYGEDDGVPISSLRITPDGRTLVYIRGSELNENGRVADPTNGVSARKQQVWAVDVDGGSPACWAKWDAARRIARTSSFLLTGNSRFGLRINSCGLRLYPVQLRLINSRICGAKIPARGGLRMDAK